MLNTRNARLFACCALIAVLAACSPAPRHVDSYTSSAGQVTQLPTDRQSCVTSCNSEFDRCGDTHAAGTQVGRSGQLTGVFGAQADCKDDMRACLSRCKGL